MSDIFPTSLALAGKVGKDAEILRAGLSGTISPTSGTMMFNLHTNPQEDESVGVRHIPLGVPLLNELNRYKDVLKKFPPTIQIKIN